MKTLHEVTQIVGMTRRVIQEYEKAGLATAPTATNKYGHLLYADKEIDRLWQIRFYRELGYGKNEMKAVFNNPHYNRKEALSFQIAQLEKKKKHLESLIETANLLKEMDVPISAIRFGSHGLENLPYDTLVPVIVAAFNAMDLKEPMEQSFVAVLTEEDENYWILISARRLDMPVTRRGCIVLYRSKNLKDWTYYGPIYSPGHTNCPECPEMYKMGGHWYLSYSRFSEFVNTIYRVSESPFGPWRKPKKDGIGGRRFYAAKSMQNDDGRRFYFGWAHDRAEQSDKGEWYWGGTFCIPHEVVPTENGELNVKLPCEYEHIFDKAVNWKYISVLGNAKDYGEKTITLNALESCSYGFLRHTEESYMLTCKIVPRETYDTFGILLKSDKEASGCLFLEFDKAMQRVSFLNLPMGVDPFWVQSCQAVPPATEPGPDGVRVCEKTMQIEDGNAIDVKIIVDHDMIEAFIDEQIAFTYRIYAKPEFETGIIAQDSNVEFYNLSISGK